MQRMFHFYCDQGGMFGQPRLHISVDPLPEPKDDEDFNNIASYYVGHMTAHGITQYCAMFNEVWSQEPTFVKDREARLKAKIHFSIMPVFPPRDHIVIKKGCQP